MKTKNCDKEENSQSWKKNVGVRDKFSDTQEDKVYLLYKPSMLKLLDSKTHLQN